MTKEDYRFSEVTESGGGYEAIVYYGEDSAPEIIIDGHYTWTDIKLIYEFLKTRADKEGWK